MLLLWLGFFALVAVLLFVDLGILHRKQEEPTMASALGWTIVWVCLGLAFSGVIYVMYDQHWGGAALPNGDGGDAAITYVSAYLLEQALSVDNLFVISLTFATWTIPPRYQHRILFWGILGAIVFRVTLLSGGAFVVEKFHWVFYLFGAYLAFQGTKLMLPEKKPKDGDEAAQVESGFVLRNLRRYVAIRDAKEHDYVFTLLWHGRRVFTTAFACLIAVELTDILFALDSIPAVMSVSHESFIMVTSNIFAILGLRSLYFVLAGAMAKFAYLKYAIALLLVMIGAKLLLHRVDAVHDLPNTFWLVAIAAILTIGVVASIVLTRSQPAEPDAQP